ncbi:MAG: SlyX family protein [Rhodoferax sp.]|uniref:SlyX family protein n=1 Tax=Rhodoferax sp. TaxID=50421 RepID=UPI001400D7AF|nr:SlyX family protein [Rhodoferax sp.]NDP37443.1 SlyX family protein [Rhodoferax sp.]
MDKPNDTEQRLMALEIKAAFTEDLLDQLDQVIVRQQEQIDLLMRELAQLREQPRDEGVVGSRSPHDDLPPHY